MSLAISAEKQSMILPSSRKQPSMEVIKGSAGYDYSEESSDLQAHLQMRDCCTSEGRMWNTKPFKL
jgi:hypothetical protein